jgi:hypothetical protein
MPDDIWYVCKYLNHTLREVHYHVFVASGPRRSEKQCTGGIIETIAHWDSEKESIEAAVVHECSDEKSARKHVRLLERLPPPEQGWRVVLNTGPKGE